MENNGIKNIVHIECIENLMSEVNSHIEMIDPKYAKEHAAKEQALSEVNDFQTGILHDFRILCEGD